MIQSTPSNDTRCTIPLNGLDGSNPLAFMAALGTLRSLSLAWPDRTVRMSWEQQEGAWRPLLHLNHETTKEELVHALDTFLKSMERHSAFSIGNDLKIAPDKFRCYLLEAMHDFLVEKNPIGTDLAAAFGCDVLSQNDNSSLIQDTAFRTMSGAGHQHFLGFMRDLISNTDPSFLASSLFHTWKYQDDKPSMRWDPIDDRQYALRWKNPSGDSIKTMRGANRLAIEGLPFFPTIPQKKLLHTTGFVGNKTYNTYLSWPIWDCPLAIDVIRSILSLLEIQKEDPNKSYLIRIGIAEVYRSRRITRGKYRNFTPAQPV